MGGNAAAYSYVGYGGVSSWEKILISCRKSVNIKLIYVWGLKNYNLKGLVMLAAPVCGLIAPIPKKSKR